MFVNLKYVKLNFINKSIIIMINILKNYKRFYNCFRIYISNRRSGYISYNLKQYLEPLIKEILT